MDCPHCHKAFHEERSYHKMKYLKHEDELTSHVFELFEVTCPSCDNFIIGIRDYIETNLIEETIIENLSEKIIYPSATKIKILAPEINNNDYIKEFTEAAQILSISPNASAALSRRLLQRILKEKAGIDSSNLARQIQEVLEKKELNTYLAKNLDAIRHYGNFGAHPNNDLKTGEIIDVEENEADYILEIVRELLNFYFVETKKFQKMNELLREKLKNSSGGGKLKKPFQ